MNQEQTKQKRPYPKLDYSISDLNKRNKIVYEIIENTPPNKLTSYYLQELAKYLTQTPNTKKQKTILTDNRMITINKRETSYQGLVSKLEKGQDGIYNFITDENKNVFLVPKIGITKEDLKTIPGLKELKQEIKKIQQKLKNSSDKNKFILIKTLIQMRQDQYVLKSMYKPPVYLTNFIKNLNKIELNEKIFINEKGQPQSEEIISLFNPEHVCHILCNYSKIKQQSWGNFENDFYYLMEYFDEISEKALKNKYPILYQIMVLKIDGMLNKDIIKQLEKKFNITYSIEYLSSLWRKKIPKIISEQVKKNWIVWYYTFKEKGVWKKCSRCNQIKLAHPYFFTRNKTSKDGYYSLCKDCRNKRSKKDK